MMNFAQLKTICGVMGKNLYEEAIFEWDGEVDYMELFRCILLTPIMVALDILTSPFQIIALITGKIIERGR